MTPKNEVMNTKTFQIVGLLDGSYAMSDGESIVNYSKVEDLKAALKAKTQFSDLSIRRILSDLSKAKDRQIRVSGATH